MHNIFKIDQQSLSTQNRHRSNVSIVNSEHNSQHFPVLLLLLFYVYMSKGDDALTEIASFAGKWNKKN